MPHSPAVGRAARFAGVAAAYFLASLVGVAFAVQPEQLAVFWPAGGLLLGYLFVVDRRRWADIAPAAFAGNLAANLVFGHSFVVAGGFAAVNAVEPLAIAWAIGRFRDGPFRLDRIADVFWLFAVPFAVCAGTAAVGAGVVTVGLGAPSYWAVWKVWWVADALGALLFAPLVLAWAGGGRAWDRARAAEIGGILVLLAAVVWGIFVSGLHARYALLAMPYPVFPVLLWVALRGDLRGISAAVTGTALIASWGTLLGRGAVGDLPASVADRVLITQGFAATVALSSLVLATALRERRTTETALRASEELLGQFVRHTPAAIAMLDTDMRYLQVSEQWQRDYHLDGQELIGRSHYEVFPDIPERWKAIHRRVLGGAVERCAEDPFPRADGGMEWLQWEARPWHLADGGVGGVIFFTQVITARKLAEEALRASEERFRLLFEQSSDAHLLFDAAGIFDCNDAAARMLRCADKAAVMSLHPAVLSPEVQPDGRRSLEKSVEMDATARLRGYHRFDWVHRRMDGDEFPCEVTLTPVTLSGRRSALLVVWHELTERLKAEADLRESEERFRAAMEGSLHAVYFLVAERGPDGAVADFRFAELNGRGAALVARPREDVIGRRLCELLPVNRTGGFFDKYARVVATGEPLEEEFPIAQADGIVASWLHHQVVRVGDGVVVTSQDITDRKAAEEALREAAAFSRGVLDALSAHIAVVDADGVITAVNRAWERFAVENPTADGVAARVGVGASYLGACDRSAAAAAGCADARLTGVAVRGVLTGVRPWSGLEYECHAPDERRWFAMSVTPLGTARGGAVISHTNVSARKLIEETVQESEARFRSAFEDAAVGMALVGLDGRWLRVNRSVCRIVGYGEAELLATDFQTLTHPADLDADLDFVRQLLAGTLATYQMEKRYFHKDGHLVWVLLAVSLVRGGGGSPLYFVSQIQDITERKRAEEALAESEERFRSLAGHAPVGIYETDADGNCTFVNARWCAFAGLSATLATGQGWVGALHPEDRDRVFAEWLAATVERREFAAEYRFRTPGGEVTWLSGSGVARHDAGGRVCGFLGTLTDITERTRAEEQVRASLREKEVLLKEIHHRVKNNLQIVSTLLDLQSEYTTDPQARVMFEESRGRVRSMALIHERLYRSTDLARVDFAEYIRQLADDLYRTYKVSDADIRLDLAVDVPPLPLDLAIPCGLLLNELMSNCFKHAFPAAAAGCIRVDLRPAADGTNVLTVADDGAGFPAGTDFRNTHSFGLQLVNTLVEQLDGEIALTAAGGTTFTVRFPTAKGLPDRTPAP